MQLIYQDPYESLDSRQTVFQTVAEPLLVHHMAKNEQETRERVFAALEAAGLHPPAEVAQRYPHHLSGGERQRVVIAAAMVCEPDLVVADEPVSMLDVSVRAEILRLMLDLRKSRELTYVFITHDLSLAWVIADRVAVMYLGRIVEIGPTEEVIRHPHHPYTKSLVTVIPAPVAQPSKRKIILAGETPSPANIPSGCRFHTRCWLWQRLERPERCRTEDPSLRPAADDHHAACHFAEEVEP
jgi:oligopeptide/dipeptide ABC transporter ATP-binding protein